MPPCLRASVVRGDDPLNADPPTPNMKLGVGGWDFHPTAQACAVGARELGVGARQNMSLNPNCSVRGAYARFAFCAGFRKSELLSSSV